MSNEEIKTYSLHFDGLTGAPIEREGVPGAPRETPAPQEVPPAAVKEPEVVVRQQGSGQKMVPFVRREEAPLENPALGLPLPVNSFFDQGDNATGPHGWFTVPYGAGRLDDTLVNNTLVTNMFDEAMKQGALRESGIRPYLEALVGENPTVLSELHEDFEGLPGNSVARYVMGSGSKKHWIVRGQYTTSQGRFFGVEFSFSPAMKRRGPFGIYVVFDRERQNMYSAEWFGRLADRDPWVVGGA